MKIKYIILALIVAFSNMAIVLLTRDNIVAILLTCFIATIFGMSIFYRWLTEDINYIKRNLEDMKEENRQIENMRSEFVTNVTHELKTPLTSISGFIETLQDGAVEDSETRNRFIEIIAIETTRLKRLIEDILLLSDIESKMQISNENIKVFEVIEEIFEMLAPIAIRKRIYMINEVYENFIIFGNEDKFRQMMVNLIENAIKYGKDDGKIWVKATNKENEKVIVVKDDGIGIEEKDLSRIAERFYRVDKSRSRKVGGTGLGLSIVKHTATLLNGELKVKSKHGKGSEFSIILKQ